MKVYYLLLIFLLIPLAYAQSYSDCSVYGNCKSKIITPTLYINETLFNVNDSYWLRGLSPQQVANLYSETDPLSLRRNGSNYNQEFFEVKSDNIYLGINNIRNPDRVDVISIGAWNNCTGEGDRCFGSQLVMAGEQKLAFGYNFNQNELTCNVGGSLDNYDNIGIGYQSMQMSFVPNNGLCTIYDHWGIYVYDRMTFLNNAVFNNTNITGTNYGFFNWLGNLASRITKLWVKDIDVNGTINATGKVTGGAYSNLNQKAIFIISAQGYYDSSQSGEGGDFNCYSSRFTFVPWTEGYYYGLGEPNIYDPYNNFNHTTNKYVIPVNGTYRLSSGARPQDDCELYHWCINTTSGYQFKQAMWIDGEPQECGEGYEQRYVPASFGMGIEKAEEDGVLFRWTQTNEYRTEETNSVIYHFTKGEEINLVTYMDADCCFWELNMAVELLYAD